MPDSQQSWQLPTDLPRLMPRLLRAGWRLQRLEGSSTLDSDENLRSTHDSCVTKSVGEPQSPSSACFYWASNACSQLDFAP